MTFRRILAPLGAGTALILIAALVVFVLWAESPLRAEPGPLDEVLTSDIGYTETEEGVVLTPAEPNGTGLVFFSGARVEPAAYAAKLASVVEAGVTVVIVRPILNFAIFEYRPQADFENAASDGDDVDTWYVGGHSLGGVKACQYAADPDNEVAGLILFGSYCASDISETDLPVLTVVAENDGLSTPAKIADAAGLLPPGNTVVTLPGAVHAQFGDYGVQPGDGTPTATDAEVEELLSNVLLKFLPTP